MPIEYELSRQAFVDLARIPTGPVRLIALRLAALIDRKAKMKLSGEMVNVRTGNLRSSQDVPIVAVVGEILTITASNRASYAAAVHNGTRPHLIVPKKAMVLTGWSFAGAPVFTPVVHHPGTRARPWLLESLREAMTETFH